jgi:hypothetical protein
VRSDAHLPGVLTPVLERLRAEAAALSGMPGAQVTPVAYQARPFSHVMRLSIARDAGHPSAFWFAKVQIPKARPDAEEHMRRRVRHEFDTTRKVESALGEYPGTEALHAIACYPDLFAIVTQEIAGVTLLRHLESRLTWFRGDRTVAEAEQAARQAGAWLRLFQGIEPTNERLAGHVVRDYIDARIQKLVSSGKSPITAAVRLRLLNHIDALIASVPPAEWRSVMRHADLAPGNVIVTSRGIAVLDFAMASRGTYLHDLTRLSLQIDLLRGKPQFRPAAVTRVRSALHLGFDPAVSPAQPLFRLLSLLHRINHLATLTLNFRRGSSWLYGWRIRRIHEHEIQRELTRSVDGGTNLLPDSGVEEPK